MVRLPNQSPPVSIDTLADILIDARDAARYRLLRQIIPPSLVEQWLNEATRYPDRAHRVDALLDAHRRMFGDGTQTRDV